MLRIYLHAPFAAYRTFTAGWYRPTATFLTPSAAYGLLLNVAGIESRLYEHDAGYISRVPASLLRPDDDLPSCRLAVGLPEGNHLPRVQSLFQQLHNYPVGIGAGISPELAMGNKNNITPIRREVLMDLHAMLALDTADGDLEDRILRGLRGELNADRYGLPFAGDNNFLVDQLAVVDSRPVYWYQRVESTRDGPHAGVTPLTTHIDRADMSRTQSALYAPAETATLEPPETAWIGIGSLIDAGRRQQS